MADPNNNNLTEAAKINEEIKKIVEQTNMTISEINEGLEKRKELEKEIADLENQKRLALLTQNQLNNDSLRLKSRELTLEAELASLVEQQRKDSLELTLDVEKNAEMLSKIAAKRQEIADNSQKQNALEQESLKNSIALEKSVDNINKKTKELLENQKKYTKEAKKTAEEQESAFDVMSEFAKEIPVIGNALSKVFAVEENMKKFASFLGRMGAALGDIPVLGTALAKSGRIVANGIGFMASAAGVATVTVGLLGATIINLAMEVNELSKELGRATGFGDKFNEELIQIAVSGNMAAIGLRESANALKALTDGLSSFNPESELMNEYMALTVARLEKLGVSTASSVKSIEHMQRAMGLNGKQAADTTAQIARLGREIGISGTKMIEDFNSASARLAIFGKQNIQVFKELAAASKASGIEMQSLISVAQKFDTFDTAADQAAKLNAVLGTQLSTIEMLQATDSERIMMLKQQVQMSVGNFDSLDKFTKQYIAQAMGVASVDEAQRLLNMSTAEYQRYQQGQKEAADIQKEISEATEQLVPVMEQLKLSMLQFFMAFSPVIQGFSQFLTLLSPVIVMVGKAMFLMGQLTLGILGVAAAFKLLTMGVAAFMVVSKIGLAIAAITGLVFVLSKFYDILHKSGSPMLYQMPTVLASAFKVMGDAILTPISLIKGLAGSFSNLFDSLHPKESGMSFNVEALAKMDTTRVAKGFNDIKSALVELSTLKVDGFLAMTSDGAKSSFVMGSDGVLKSISEGRLTVDVQMPEMKIPDISVKVYIGDTELRNIIRQEAEPIVDKKFRRG